MKPYYQHGGITIYHGDCREILPSVEADVMVTDPPYGIAWSAPGKWRSGLPGSAPIAGDDEPFDPSHLLRFTASVLFGANHYANKLPARPGWLVWDKRAPGVRQTQGDGELAWTTILGTVRTIRFLWNGGGTFLRENGSYESYHPAQKPVGLMAAILEMKETPSGTVVDPYAGSGSTLVAAKDMGRRAIGIEIEERYCEIAAKRLAQETLFGSVLPKA